jgi:hypothetical protein
LFAQGIGGHPCECEESLIERAIEVILAVRAGQFGAAFVEKPGKNDVSAKTGTGATGWAFGEIGYWDHGVQ